MIALNTPLCGSTLDGRQQRKNRKCAGDVHQCNQCSGAEYRTRKRTPRITHLFAHRGDKLKPSESKRDLRPEVHRVPVPRRHHVLHGKVRRRAVLEHDDHRYEAKYHERQIRADAAGILQPLADIQANDVEDHRNQEQSQRNAEQKRPILGELRSTAANDVCGHRCAGEQKARKVEDGVDPVGPAGDKPVEVAEGFLRPGIQAALFWKPRRKLIDDQRARNEKEDCRDHPQADGGCSVVAGGGDPTGAQNRGDVEQQHIPEAHGLAQLGLGILRRRRKDRHKAPWASTRPSSVRINDHDSCARRHAQTFWRRRPVARHQAWTNRRHFPCPIFFSFLAKFVIAGELGSEGGLVNI